MQRASLQCREPCLPSTSYSSQPASYYTPRAQLLHRRFSGYVIRKRTSTVVLDSLSSEDEPVGEDLGWSSRFSEHYVRGRLLGAGSFGTVYLGIDLRTGHEVAVKVLPKIRGKLTKERTLAKIHKEVSILSRLQECPNVIQLLGLYEHESEVLVVTEVCKGGDLQRLFEVGRRTWPRTYSLHTLQKQLCACFSAIYVADCCLYCAEIDTSWQSGCTTLCLCNQAVSQQRDCCCHPGHFHAHHIHVRTLPSPVPSIRPAEPPAWAVRAFCGAHRV